MCVCVCVSVFEFVRHFVRRDLDTHANATDIDYDEISLAVVSNDDYDVILDETKLASLKGITGIDRDNMIKAICKEITGIIDAGTFELCPLPRGSRAIPTKLVLKIKYRADGSYDRHKSRLVVQGFHQRLGKDYFGTFAPMANFTNLRLIISLAVYYGWGQNQNLRLN